MIQYPTGQARLKLLVEVACFDASFAIDFMLILALHSFGDTGQQDIPDQTAWYFKQYCSRKLCWKMLSRIISIDHYLADSFTTNVRSAQNPRYPWSHDWLLFSVLKQPRLMIRAGPVRKALAKCLLPMLRVLSSMAWRDSWNLTGKERPA